MADVRYTVVADFTLDSRRAASGMGQIAESTKKVKEGLTAAVFKGTLLANAVSSVASMMARAAMFGARMFGSWISRGVEFNATMEKTKVGLGAIISTASGVTFAQGFEQADYYAKLLVKDAAKSVATTRDLFAVFAEVAGPIIGMGKGLEKVREITKGTIAAAAALTVDFAQARRDIGMMLTGAAGVDVKLFRMLRSSRAITQSTKEWNDMLPVKRLEALTVALAKFQVASEAYAMTWAGVTSTFDDLFELFAGAGTESLTEQVKFVVADINKMLGDNYDAVIAWFRLTFEFMGKTVREGYKRIKKLTENNWEEIKGVWKRASDYFNRILLPLFYDFEYYLGVMGTAFKIMLVVFAPLINAARIFIVLMRLAADGWEGYTKALGKGMDYITSGWANMMSKLAVGLDRMTRFVVGMLNRLPGVNIGLRKAPITGAEVQTMMFGGMGDMFGSGSSFADYLESLFPKRGGLGLEEAPGATTAKRGKPPAPVIDMRGSRITIKQDFRDADPDRIALHMMNDLARAAESRTQSSFAPALSR